MSLIKPMHYYERMAKQWEITKPIRGRGVDTRPIGKRSRDWELIVRMLGADGIVTYGAKLYNTVCVEYFPDSSFIVRHDDWATAKTAEFISATSPFRCRKVHNFLWMFAHDGDGVKAIPVTKDGIKFMHDGTTWRCVNMPSMKRRKVGSYKAKQARKPLAPFLKFAKTFLRMSDGWVMHETCKHVLGWKHDNHGYGESIRSDEERVYKMLTDSTDPLMTLSEDERHLFMLCLMSRMSWFNDSYDNKRRVAERFEYVENYNGTSWPRVSEFYDVRVEYERLKHVLYRWVNRFEDVHVYVDAEIGSKPILNACIA